MGAVDNHIRWVDLPAIVTRGEEAGNPVSLATAPTIAWLWWDDKGRAEGQAHLDCAFVSSLNVGDGMVCDPVTVGLTVIVVVAIRIRILVELC
jgi:hypothetical protein